MSSENQLRSRQAKKKIFYEEANRMKPQDKNFRENNPKVTQSQIGKSVSAVQQLKKHLQQLQLNNTQLKRILREERQRYDRLFEEYQQLAQKNSLIEKEYINLKYQHNREIKELKQSLSSIITQKVDIGCQQLEVSLKQEKASPNLRAKLQKFLQKMKELAKFTEKYRLKKGNKKGNQVYQFFQDKEKPRSIIVEKTLSSQKKMQLFQLQDDSLVEKEPKVTKSPQKQKDLSSVKSQSEISNKEVIVFEDEYYGQIEDFAQYEQKVIQRRNYELMRKNSRNSNQIKRKKIFEQI